MSPTCAPPCAASGVKNNYKHKNRKNKYTPQGFLQSLTVYRVKEIISHLLFKSEIPPEDLHLSAQCRCNDGNDGIISLENEFYTNLGERKYPEGDMERNKNTREIR